MALAKVWQFSDLLPLVTCEHGHTNTEGVQTHTFLSEQCSIKCQSDSLSVRRNKINQVVSVKKREGKNNREIQTTKHFSCKRATGAAGHLWGRVWFCWRFLYSLSFWSFPPLIHTTAFWVRQVALDMFAKLLETTLVVNWCSTQAPLQWKQCF